LEISLCFHLVGRSNVVYYISIPNSPGLLGVPYRNQSLCFQYLIFQAINNSVFHRPGLCTFATFQTKWRSMWLLPICQLMWHLTS